MSNGSLDSALSSVIGNEELMSKISTVLNSNNKDMEKSLPEVMSLISDSIGASSEKKTDNDEKSDTPPAESSAFEGIFKGLNGLSRNRALLCALRPYLSEKRGQMIDSLLKLEQIGEIMKIAR